MENQNSIENQNNIENQKKDRKQDKNHDKKKLWIILLLMIVVILLIAAMIGGVFLLKGRKRGTPAPPSNVPAGSVVVWRRSAEYVNKSGLVPGDRLACEYTYDKLGRCIQIDYHDTMVGQVGNYVNDRTKYEYLEEEKVTREIMTSEEGQDNSSMRVYEYDSDGNLLHFEYYGYSKRQETYQKFTEDIYGINPFTKAYVPVAGLSYDEAGPEFISGSWYDEEKRTEYRVDHYFTADETKNYNGDWKSIIQNASYREVIEKTVYDEDGKIARVTLSNSTQTYEDEYDDQGECIRRSEYDGSGNLTMIRQTQRRTEDLPDGGHAEIIEDIVKQGTQGPTVSKKIKKVEYNAQGQLTAVIENDNGLEVTNLYDDQGRKIKWIDNVSGDISEYEYDAYGNLTKFTYYSNEYGRSISTYEYVPMVISKKDLEEAGLYYLPNTDDLTSP